MSSPTGPGISWRCEDGTEGKSKSINGHVRVDCQSSWGTGSIGLTALPRHFGGTSLMQMLVGANVTWVTFILAVFGAS
jgi:hypothetical protein